MIEHSIDEISQILGSRNVADFNSDYQEFLHTTGATMARRDILIIGAAGSIGESATKLLAKMAVKKLTLVDSNENALVRLLRDLRADPSTCDTEIDIISLDYTSQLFEVWLKQHQSFDSILNFAAAKHVRAERDSWSIAQMFHTNLAPLRNIFKTSQNSSFFSVSTDKASDPVNFMGLSKYLMEQFMFHDYPGSRSARFANVAFSNGSLLESWYVRANKGQVLSVPRNCHRYFVSLKEAGEICVVSAFYSGADFQMAVPIINLMNLTSLETLILEFLNVIGKRPIFTEDSQEAFEILKKKNANEWPVLLTPLDTQGEKVEEIFSSANEVLKKIGGLDSLEEIKIPLLEADVLNKIWFAIENFKEKCFEVNSVERLKEELQTLVPKFQHFQSGHVLDSRI
jgi:FlaA1/EpsC-like NDP-sugar epimerase